MGSGRGAGWLTVLMLVLLLPMATQARTLEEIRQSGQLTLCVYPSLLPFSSDKDNPPGIHVELGREVASALGVRLNISWIVPRSRRKTGICDLGFDEREGQEVKGYGITVSRPYLRTGVALWVREASGVHAYADLRKEHRIGVSLGSEAEAYLKSRDLPVRSFAMAPEMEQAFLAGELDAVLVPAHATSYAMQTQPVAGTRLLHAYREEPQLAWNLVAVLRAADDAYLVAVNDALAKLMDSGRMAPIYGAYGIPYIAPVVSR